MMMYIVAIKVIQTRIAQFLCWCLHGNTAAQPEKKTSEVDRLMQLLVMVCERSFPCGRCVSGESLIEVQGLVRLSLHGTKTVRCARNLPFNCCCRSHEESQRWILEVTEREREKFNAKSMNRWNIWAKQAINRSDEVRWYSSEWNVRRRLLAMLVRTEMKTHLEVSTSTVFFINFP